MNSIIIKGRLTADPEIRKTQSDISVCSVSVAVDRSYSKDGEKEADFFTCIFWRNQADFLGKYFHKGQEIIVQGEMQSRRFEDKNGNKRIAWEIQANRCEFCGPKSDGDSKKNLDVYEVAETAAPADEDDLPF